MSIGHIRKLTFYKNKKIIFYLIFDYSNIIFEILVLEISNYSNRIIEFKVFESSSASFKIN